MMDVFGDATRRWFEAELGRPTRVQIEGWKRVAAGEHTLMLAPTGSGKTLAAFLWCIDRLGRAPRADAAGVRALYVSPLKALAYDIERNLERPLAGIRRAAADLGGDVRSLRVDVRTGDTSASERRRQARQPGDILITTPESLFLLLGSGARDTLRGVDTVIVDEIHAVAANKRGAHLALSLERLGELCARDPQRIGLSATQRPLEEIARYLGGDRPVAIVDASEPPRIDLEIVVPVEDMTAPLGASGAAVSRRALATPEERTSIWPSIYPRLLELIQAHRSTIIFVNSRRLAERLAQQVNELAGQELVRAHHGSVARHRREQIERMLKAGELPAITATSSLELGIDMGAVDLVVQIESPGSVARGLQRIGRAGHAVGAVSRGRVFPKFRGDLIEAAVVCHDMAAGRIEPIRVPTNTLDVLAQQLVAMCADRSRSIDDLERMVRRSYGYRQLSRDALIEVLDMLTGRYPSDRFADLRPRLAWNRDSDVISARPGAKMTALVNAGTIPDRGLYAAAAGRARRRDGVRVATGRDVPARRVDLADRGDHARSRDREPGAGRDREDAVLAR
jgi:ATP-dependent Lhr-like helicase